MPSSPTARVSVTLNGQPPGGGVVCQDRRRPAARGSSGAASDQGALALPLDHVAAQDAARGLGWSAQLPREAAPAAQEKEEPLTAPGVYRLPAVQHHTLEGVVEHYPSVLVYIDPFHARTREKERRIVEALAGPRACLDRMPLDWQNWARDIAIIAVRCPALPRWLVTAMYEAEDRLAYFYKGLLLQEIQRQDDEFFRGDSFSIAVHPAQGA